ncbi:MULTISPECIES: GTP cyclohydrolase I [Curtobacterium]|uniref:GTP cyclohydrolase 1 n=1 Tax=Curtobacterium poinsettiae TaxID=159612 RepID=A0ABT3S0G9_9MICO|nr:MULTISPECIES: GTP cyclohydrolase I [Curtobacterium]MBT1608822.1 GTP cyclohydrolase I [Curtobacterium flaccumfaciens pv. poinsettiae]MCS6566927.1 GTP cyclohydrolase I [Curtobacterium flaccumfaciens pv. flaccumfaciens]MCX2848259.1 GTP cyclohydrolase I [Curtobacterium flaccumfaciens pv. poinsettiae]UXN20173.1 GTP cyclohydrolase I [Curtobacterium flaccumfaciens pv. poinsettiae]UXZ59571.1 GTP cyclohydrolase I [Curtobacterium sp. Arg-1]
MDRARVEAAVRELLLAIGEDPDRPELTRTPARVADSYSEFFSGIGTDAVAIARDGTVHAEDGERGRLVIVRDVKFRSVCEHHLLPFLGVAHLAYAPGERLIGLGTLARVLDAVASRPQLQERLGEQVTATIAEGLGAEGVLVVLDAQHQCVTTRGERQTGSTTVTVAATGSLADTAGRAEAIALIGAGRGTDAAGVATAEAGA